MTNWEHLGGNSRDIIEVLSRYWTGWTEQNHK